MSGASLLPENFGGGAIIPDGRYTITGAETTLFDYNGAAPEGPACKITYKAADGTDYEQHYSAGKIEFLVPSKDHTEFEHPAGEVGKVSKSSNFAAFVAAIVTAGFPREELSTKVGTFVGADVEVENKAQDKRPGLKDQKEGKTIPLPVKYYGKASGKGKATSKAAPAAKAASNGDVEASATAAIRTALEGSNEGEAGLKEAKIMFLATKVLTAMAKEKNPAGQEIYKLAKSTDWLKAHADAGGWIVEGDSLQLIPS